MTKIKKTMALLMVLVMAMTTLILPASAATVEGEVEPCAISSVCPKCDAYCNRAVYTLTANEIATCVNSSSSHYHRNTYRITATYTCNCGYVFAEQRALLTSVCSVA